MQNFRVVYDIARYIYSNFNFINIKNSILQNSHAKLERLGNFWNMSFVVMAIRL